MPTVAFLTDRVRPTGAPDDRLALPALAARGVDVVFVPWEDAVPRADIAAWFVRSPWNYAAQAPAFLARLDRLRPLFNPMPLLLWNSDKRYLIELAEAEIDIIPSVVAPRDHLVEIAESTGFEEVVIKPLVSAGGAHTLRLRADALAALDVRTLPVGDYFVQPFLDDVLYGGELSCVFFDGVYSHSVRKYAAKGNFLVQEEHGGRTEPAMPSEALIEASLEVLRAAPDVGHYARVDWIETERGPKLVELELIEPELYLRAHPYAPARFAGVVVNALKERA